MSDLDDVGPLRRGRSLYVRRTIAAFTLAALVAAACSSDDGTLGDPVASDAPATTASPSDGPGTDTGRLAAVALDAASGDPFDRVSVTGLAGLPTDEIALWMRTPDPEMVPDDVFVPVYLAEGGGSADEAELVVPFHPTDPMAGGPVEFYVGDEAGAAGPTITFTIGPLSPAEGAWNEFLDEFRARIDEAAAELGSSADELAELDFDDVPHELLPLKISLSYLDDGTGNSLVAIYDSPELTDEDRILLDALTAQMGLAEVFEANEAFADTLGPDETIGDGGTPTGFRRPADGVAGIPAERSVIGESSAAAPLQSGGSCIAGNVTVSNAAELAAKLDRAQRNTITEGGPVDKVLSDIGTVTTVGGFIPGVGWIIGAGGAVFSGIEAYHNGVAGLYPSRITALDAQITIDEFLEDFTVDGFWHDVSVLAESTGWRGDADVFGTVLSGTAAGTSAILGRGLDVVSGLVLDTDLFITENLANVFIRSRESGVLEFCPQQWVVDVTGEPWSFGSIQLDRFETDSELRNYRPVDTGITLPFEDLLRIELNFEQFRNQMVWKEFPVRVGPPIRVSGPAEVEVDNPIDLVDIEIVVDRAHDISLDWVGEPGAWRGEPRLTVADPATWVHTHIAAIDEADFPYVIAIRSASTSGLRANGDPPRVHTVVVRLRELIVRPAPGGVLTGDRLQFTATDRNGNPVEVEWSATGGTIDANGVYTAGDTPGIYTVTAIEVGNPERRTTVSVQVDDGSCLAGVWRLRTQPFLDEFMQFVPMAAEAVEIGGQYLVEFGADGSFEGRRENWTWGVTIPGTGITTTRIDSVERGTWTILPGIDGGPSQLRINESSSDGTVEVTVEAGGMTMALPGGEQQFSDAGISGQGPFTCTDNLLTLTASGDGLTITAELDRIG